MRVRARVRVRVRGCDSPTGWDGTLHDSGVVLPEETLKVLVHKGCEAGGGQCLVVVVEDDKGCTQGVQA